MTKKVIPIELRVQNMVCELLDDTKARFEQIVEWLAEEVKKDQINLEEEKHRQYGNPAMYQGFIDTHLELIAHHRQSIARLDSLISQARELERKLALFWEDEDKVCERRLKESTAFEEVQHERRRP